MPIAAVILSACAVVGAQQICADVPRGVELMALEDRASHSTVWVLVFSDGGFNFSDAPGAEHASVGNQQSVFNRCGHPAKRASDGRPGDTYLRCVFRVRTVINLQRSREPAVVAHAIEADVDTFIADVCRHTGNEFANVILRLAAE